MQDRFNNPFAPGLPYARGSIIRSTQDDLTKLGHAWSEMRTRMAAGGPGAVHNLSGLERRIAVVPDDLSVLDDELAPALYNDRLKALALEHLGGTSERHDVVVLNRQTAAILAATLCMVKPGETVIGVSPTYSHPCVVRAVGRAGARFIDTVGLTAFKEAMAREDEVTLVVLTRLAVSYEILHNDDLGPIVELAHRKGARVLVDDAGGARVGPAVFDQPRTLALGVDVGCTGLDKYGTVGPRLGLLGGDAELVAQIRATAFEMGLEARPMLYPAVVHSLQQYDPARVRTLVETTRKVGSALKAKFGNRVSETPVTVQLRGDDILEMAMERARITTPPVVPVEATAGLAMLLLRDHGVLTVHFAGIPPGTSALLIKFVPPETLDQFGGEHAFVAAIDASLDQLAAYVADPDAMRALLFGAPQPITPAPAANQAGSAA